MLFYFVGVLSISYFDRKRNVFHVILTFNHKVLVKKLPFRSGFVQDAKGIYVKPAPEFSREMDHLYV